MTNPISLATSAQDRWPAPSADAELVPTVHPGRVTPVPRYTYPVEMLPDARGAGARGLHRLPFQQFRKSLRALWRTWLIEKKPQDSFTGSARPRPQNSYNADPNKAWKVMIGVIAPGILLALSPTVAAQTHHATAKRPSPVVVTSKGPVEGFIGNGVATFRGIPYAEPPVGDLRWQPPKDHAPWTDVRQAKEFAPICARVTPLAVFSGPANNNEDCLYLNVFTPDLKPSASLPVIVYIHGGGNLTGETSGYDGSKLAAKGRVVVVTIAYRLNLMGFLAHPALDSEDHLFGNYGFLDQQAALRWIQRNISRFGGDKDNVTVGGQSAGAVDTMAQMVSPLATGLFHRAICQSSCDAGSPLKTKAEAEATGIAFAEAAGCGSGVGPEVARCLRNLPAAKIEALAGTASWPSRFVGGSGLMVDGQIIPDQPWALFKSGRFNHVPLLIGTTKDEWQFIQAVMEYWTNADNTLRKPATEQDRNFINMSFAPPGYSAETVARIPTVYPPGAFKSPQMAANRIITDSWICNMRRLNRALAPQIPVYTYLFADSTAPSYFPDMPGMKMGAYHTSDIQYVFPLWHGGPDGIPKPLNSRQAALSDKIISAWANFTRTGNPNGVGNSPWPRYTLATDAPAWLIQDLPGLSRLTDRQFSTLYRCDFWDSALQAH